MPFDEAQPTPTIQPQPATAPADSAPAAPRRRRRWIYDGKVRPAFWTIASIASLLVNLILIIIVFFLARYVFDLKRLVQDNVLGGLYANFELMDTAHIRAKIPVSASVPAKFDLPLSTTTMVTLTEDTSITGATIYELNAGALYISRANTNIILPAGTNLPIQLNLTVPVDQQIPVNLMVDVDIPLNQTELHQPFVGLKDVIEPFYKGLLPLPNNWKEVFQSKH
jgi:hypothetical protein